jgi:hypothetical protein
MTTDPRVAQFGRLRPGADLEDPDEAVKLALRSLARRHKSLSLETGELETRLDELSARVNQALRGAKGVGALDGSASSCILLCGGMTPKALRLVELVLGVPAGKTGTFFPD